MSDDKEIRINVEDGNDLNNNDETDKTEQPETTADPQSNDTPEPVEKIEEVEEKSEEEKLLEKLTISEEKLLLALADFENYKKRQTRRQEEFYRTANDGLIIKLLDVIDNFQRAIDHAGEPGSGSSDSLLDGTRMILKQLHDILSHYQIVPIEAVGQPFDPNLHEALMHVESDEYEEGINSVEIAKGYKAGNRILRHAKVGVSKGGPKAKPEDTPETESNDDKQAD